MNLFLESDYRKIVKALFREMPNAGRGSISRLARHLGVNTTLVSQVLSGRRHFTEEQTAATARFLGFNQKETFYFLLLVQRSRTDDADLKSLYARQIQTLQQQARDLKGQVETQARLAFGEQAVYYSIWQYAAVHTVVNLSGCDTVKAIAKRLAIDDVLVSGIVESLTSFGLLAERHGKLVPGMASTYLSPDSPLVIRHHQSWRQRAHQAMDSGRAKDLFFTAPFSISSENYDLIRRELTDFIARLYKIVEKSKSEDLACLNMDLFRF